MRTTTSGTQSAWLSGDYIGSKRPMVRATIQRLSLCVLTYGKQQYSSVPFGQANKPLELPNIKDVTWSRSVDNGVATMSMTLYNTEPLPVGEPPQDGDLDQPGYFSPLRGNTAHSSRWDRGTNGWQDWIVPDRIIRTYEGYGWNASVAPEVDPHLYLSGTWRIDDVTFTQDGTGPLITIACRDIGSVLLDQIAFPPIVPFACYPVWFETIEKVANPPIITSTGGWIQPLFDTSSNRAWIGDGGSVSGHVGTDAFDTSDSSYWLSIGNACPNADYSFEYIQGKFPAQDVAGGQFRVWGGPYTCYVSVYAANFGGWQGDQTVPYNPNDPISAPNGSDIRFVTSFHVNNEQTVAFSLPAIVSGATKVRLTFTNLSNSGIGPYYYRAGVRSFKVSGEVSHSSPGGTRNEPATTPPGIRDYTDIVKLFLAWAGFYWPREKSHAFLTYSNGTKVTEMAPSNDPVLIQGRVWGDLEQTGTSPLVAIPVDTWDKKPVMDCIVAGTLVKVPGGHKPIEDLRLGDVVANRGGYGRVTGRKSQLATSVVATVIDGERIVTSAGHLFWTVRGWVRADELRVGDEIRRHSESLRMVRGGVRRDDAISGEVSQEDVFGTLSTGVGGGAQDAPAELCLSSVRGGVQGGLGEEVLLPAMLRERSKHSAESDLCGMWQVVPSQGVHTARLFDGVSSTGAPIESDMGRPHRTAVHALAGAGRRLVSRVLDVATRGRRGHPLDSGGCGQPRLEGGDRGGRSQPHLDGQAGEGSAARRMAGFARVDGIEVLQCGDHGWADLCDEHGQVILWDLSVDGDPSFIVGKGELVAHNCINYVRDIVGFIFYIDEGGAAVFRSPNIWSVGNWVGDGGPSTGRTSTIIDIDETQVLMNLSATMSSRSIREKIFVGNISGQIAAMANGHNPYPSGLRRVGGFCVDTETEIFTKRGWLHWDEVAPGDYTLSINEATGQSIWQPIRDVAIFEDAERDMLEFSANNFSAVTTHDHRWFVERYSTKTKTWERRYVASQDLTTMDRIPRAVRREDGLLTPVVKDDLVELVAWIYTEGTVKTSRGGTQRLTLSQSQSANPEYCERIRNLLGALYGPATTEGRLKGAAWRERAPRRAGEVVWELSSGASQAVLAHLGEHKEPSMGFLDSLTQAQLELFINVSIMADGHERFTSEFSKVQTRQFYQNVGPRLDAFLAACAMAGIPTSYQQRTFEHGTAPHATVTLLQSDYYPPAQSRSGQKREQRGGIVWCPTMFANHTWLARRKGSVYYTGNTDQHFLTTKECQIMADLITLRQLFTYRTDKITIPGNPAIQIDDQVRIYERTSEEAFLHYIVGIQMNWSLETGKYTYALDTYWLGDEAFSSWTFNPADLAAETQQYLKSIGKIP